MSKRKYHNPFGDYIRKLREDHKYTLQDIEAKSGISATYLSQLEHRANAKTRQRHLSMRIIVEFRKLITFTDSKL
jgi:transcriptional regulator with XRE-family HTH domain